MDRLRVLLVEDSPSDALLLERELQRGGYAPEIDRVETEAGLRTALAGAPFDLVLSDYALPGWSGIDALAVVRAASPELPFILVSGTIGEDVAVGALHAGADDYLLKDRLARLPASVAQALAAAELREEHGRSRVALAFLAQASVRLSESLDSIAIADTLVALVVPLLADAAAAYVVDDGGDVHCAAASDDRGDGDAHVAAEGGLVREAVRTRLPALGAGEAHGTASRVALPLVVRDTALGCLVLAVEPSERSFKMIDGGLGVELAARAALALQNARLYTQAQAAIATRDEFLQIAAHELRTPLTPLSTQVQALLRAARADRASAGARFEAEIAATGRHVQRLTALVDQLLDVSALGVGRPRLVREPVDLAALVAEVAARCGPQASEAGSLLAIEAPAPVVGTWDRGRLTHVLAQLLGNALKFGAGKPVAVTVSADRGIARLCVHDQGPGIAPADRARIFERFERAVPISRYGGFGLGLWVAREIVTAHGGTIDVASDLGAGATFTVGLPCEPPQN